MIISLTPSRIVLTLAVILCVAVSVFFFHEGLPWVVGFVLFWGGVQGLLELIQRWKTRRWRSR